jgi:hypothetical protein
MQKVLQRSLLAVGVIALLALGAEILLSLAGTTHGSTPARVVQVTAGPYPLTVSLYTDPANAGFALPFAIAPRQPTLGSLSFDVSSLPGQGVQATPVRASISPDVNTPGGVQGAAEITVQGPWTLHVVVNGPAGQGEVDVPVRATAPPGVPEWLGWGIGLLPLCGLLVFLLLQRGRNEEQEQMLLAR